MTQKMTTFQCSPATPWGIHHSVRNDEACPRCGWTAPGPKSDRRRDADLLAAEHGWTVIPGGASAPELPETRAA
ncbi:MAG TPA: hypothetical protein VEZ20_01675 [Allosphingosinicella sp.]|nr:hypothetical protein [Allosphingosinicella sp.]